MVKTIAKWVLKLVDFDIDLVGDLLTLTITVGGVQVFKRTFDLIPDDQGILRSKK